MKKTAIAVLSCLACLCFLMVFIPLNFVAYANEDTTRLDFDGTQLVIEGYEDRNNYDADTLYGLFSGNDGSTRLTWTDSIAHQGTFTIKLKDKIKAVDYKEIKIRICVGNWEDATITTKGYSVTDTEFANAAGSVDTGYGNVTAFLVLDSAKLADANGDIEKIVICRTSSNNSSAGQYFLDYIDLIAKSETSGSDDLDEYLDTLTDIHYWKMSATNWADFSAQKVTVYQSAWIGNNGANHNVVDPLHTEGDTNMQALTSAKTDATGSIKFTFGVYGWDECGSGKSDRFDLGLGSYVLSFTSEEGWNILELTANGTGNAQTKILKNLTTDALVKVTPSSVQDWDKMEKNTVALEVKYDENASLTTVTAVINDNKWVVTSNNEPFDAIFDSNVDASSSAFLLKSDAKNGYMMYIGSTIDEADYVPEYEVDQNFTSVKDISQIIPVNETGVERSTAGNSDGKGVKVFLRKDLEDYNVKMKIKVSNLSDLNLYATFFQTGADSETYYENGGFWIWINGTVVNMKSGDETKLADIGITLAANQWFEYEYGLVRCNTDGAFSGYQAYVKINGTEVVKGYVENSSLGTKGKYSGLFLHDGTSGKTTVTIAPVQASSESPVEVKLSALKDVKNVDDYTRFKIELKSSFDQETLSNLILLEGSDCAEIVDVINSDGTLKYQYLKVTKENGGKIKVKVTLTNEFGTFDSNVVEFTVNGSASGCGSSVTGGNLLAVAVITAIALAILVLKRRKSND